MITTTIRINKKTKLILDDLKIHSRETYDDLLNRIIEHLNGDKILKRSKER